jgi:quercetin dioxygenase-like cupin family protein
MPRDGIEPEVVWMPGGVRTEIQLDGAETGGAFCLLVDEPPAGWSLPPHAHRDAAETIHVVAGEFAMDVDGMRTLLGAGDSIHIPRGVVHGGVNVGDTTGRRIVLFSPAGMEAFFREAGASSADAEADAPAALAAAVRHGWEFVR